VTQYVISREPKVSTGLTAGDRKFDIRFTKTIAGRPAKPESFPLYPNPISSRRPGGFQPQPSFRKSVSTGHQPLATTEISRRWRCLGLSGDGRRVRFVVDMGSSLR
jgi:hypothetical protein